MVDHVLLFTDNFPLERNLSRKLSLKYIGPTTAAKESASGLSFRLHLPAELGRTHPTTQFSWLNSYPRSRQNQEVLETQIAFELQPELRPVEKVFATCTRNSVEEVLAYYADRDCS